MRMMKKSVSLLLCLVMLISVFTILPIATASAVSNRTMTVGIISYEVSSLGENGWQVHYYGVGVDDYADLVATGTAITRSCGDWAWGGAEQTFYIFTTQIPANAQLYQVNNGSKYYGNDVSVYQNVAYVFDWSGAQFQSEHSYSEAGYYVLGTDENWTINSNNKLSADPLHDGNYVYKNMYLTTGSQFKIVSNDGSDDHFTYYPGDADNFNSRTYLESGSITEDGYYNIYFSPTYTGAGFDCYGCILVQKPLFTEASLSLLGDIGVNFKLNKDYPGISEAATVHFAWGAKTADVNPVAKYDDGNNLLYYTATCNVAAAEMTSEITATVTLQGHNDPEYQIAKYSVKQYADYIIANSANADLVALAKAMLDYGTAAQVQFEVNAAAPANGGTYYNDLTNVTVTVDEPNDQTNDIDFTGASLALKSKTSLMLAFTGDEIADILAKNNYTFDNYDDTEIQNNVEGFNVVIVRGIPAAELNDKITVYLNNFGCVYYCPLYYCKKVLDSTTADDTLKTTVKALYVYADAAKAYFRG